MKMLKRFISMHEDEEISLLDRKSAAEGRKSVNSGWVVTFVAVASQVMLCKGLNSGIIGPTLPFLASNINSNIDETSNMLTARGAGAGAGALAFSAIKSKAKDAKAVVSSGIGIFVIATVGAIMPFTTSLVELAVIQIFAGFGFGYSLSALTSIYLTYWGESRSQPFIQFNYFMFSVGGFLAPLIARPFLEMENQTHNVEGRCPERAKIIRNDIVSDWTTPVILNSVTVNPISWAYIIISVYTAIVALFFGIIAIAKVEEKLRVDDYQKIESMPEESFKKIWKFLTSVLMFYFFCLPCNLIFQAYIYSTVVCSGLKMQPSQATLLNSIFWVGFGIARGTAVITSKFLKPSTLIVTGLVGTISIMTTMSIWGEDSPILMWIGTFTFGLFVAILAPSGISWSSQVTNLRGKYVFVFVVGGNTGSLVLYRVAGAIFQLNPFFPIYLIAGLCGAAAISFLCMNYFAPCSKNSGGTTGRN